jgi:hypothetical protein
VKIVTPDEYVTEFAVNAMLCDTVDAVDGKLYIHGGGWNLISPSGYPTRIPRVGLAALVSVPYTATNQNHTLGIQLQDQDGHVLPFGPGQGVPGNGPNVGAQFNVGRPPILQRGDPQNMPFAMNIDGLMIDGPGAYSFVLTIDGKELQRLTFRASAAGTGTVTS